MKFNKKRPPHSKGGHPAKALHPRNVHSNKVHSPTETRGTRMVVGLHSCREAIKIRPEAICEAWFKEGYEANSDHCELFELLQRKRIPIHKKSIQAMDKVCGGHQGLCLFLKTKPEFAWSIFEEEQKQHIVLVLDGLEDPHNFGAIIRTAWLMGVTAIIIPKDRSVGLTPTVHKVASGGVEHVPILETSDFFGTMEKFKKLGFWVYGLAASATKSIYDSNFADRVVLIIGSEESGMRKPTERLCDELQFIPQTAKDSSYNASVSAAIALSEARRQLSNTRKIK